MRIININILYYFILLVHNVTRHYVLVHVMFLFYIFYFILYWNVTIVTLCSSTSANWFNFFNKSFGYIPNLHYICK